LPVLKSNFFITDLEPLLGFIREESAHGGSLLFVEFLQVKPEIPENGFPPGSK
jgi:hypothetical protein